MNLYRKLVKLFTEEVVVPEVKDRVRVNLKKRVVVAEVWMKTGWVKIREVDLDHVALDTAIERAKAYLEAYKLLGLNEEGVLPR